MNIVTQIKHWRQRLVKYAQIHGATEAAIRYKVSRKTVHKWLRRYDGTLESLSDQSHRPKTSPRKHTDDELRKIRRRLKRHKWKDLILAYQELVERDGYTRSYGGFKRIAAKLKSWRHRSDKSSGFIQITVLALNDGTFELHLRDNAIEFNPFSLEGGYVLDSDDLDATGILMIRRRAKEFFYRRFQGFNTLIITV